MDKFVYVKSAETMQGKNGAYLRVKDQDSADWNVFSNITPTPIIGKCYLFSFEKNGEWNNLTKITPLVNIFQQKALKEVANRNDFKRDYSIATSYAVQLASGGKIGLDDLFLWADKIYDRFQQKADEEMGKLNET